MSFFRPHRDLHQALARPASAADLTEISRLLSQGRYHYTRQSEQPLAELLGQAPALVLANSSNILAAAVADYPYHETAWIDSFALADGVGLDAAFAALIPPFHKLVGSAGARKLYYAGSPSTDSWLAVRLRGFDYRQNTFVISYIKQQLDIPAYGNPRITLRRPQDSDLSAVCALDTVCFEPQWVKDSSVMSRSLFDMPFFVVAELEGAILGYAYAASYFNGKQIHLVRIAVAPHAQGQGIGIRLLAEVVLFARSLQATAITLNTQEYNLHAQRLYSWFGFQLSGERQLILNVEL